MWTDNDVYYIYFVVSSALSFHNIWYSLLLFILQNSIHKHHGRRIIY